jgi:hypothetical protein
MLTMTRNDIANYLGMVIRTVNRIFASFQQRKITAVQLRYLSFLDFAALKSNVVIDICSQPFTRRKHPRQVKYAIN